MQRNFRDMCNAIVKLEVTKNLAQLKSNLLNSVNLQKPRQKPCKRRVVERTGLRVRRLRKKLLDYQWS